MKTHDALFLGTSPNALCAAALLARAGQSVVLLDARNTPGGPVATEYFAPGFQADTGVPHAALAPEIVDDLDLPIEEIRRETITSLAAEPVTLREVRPSVPGDTLQSSRTPFSSNLAFKHPALPGAFHDAVHLLRAVHRMPSPDIPRPAGADVANLAVLSSELYSHGPRGVHELLRLLFLSVRDFLHEADVPPAVQGLLATVAMRSVFAGPFDEGTLLGLALHTANDDGLYCSSAWGGLGQLARVLADKARSFGAEIRTGVAGPLRVDVEDGAARGVILSTGERISAKMVISDHDVETTFTRLVDPADLDPEFNRAVRRVRHRGTVARVHLALDRLPTFWGVSLGAIRGTLVLAPDVASIERARDEAKRGRLPAHPPMEVVFPTAVDTTLAPPGKHVLDAAVQYVPYGCVDRAALLKTVIDNLTVYAPDLPSLVLHSHVSLPEDIESRFGLTGGHLFGGETSHAQAFFLRPMPGLSRYRTPIENLYLAGSAAHPPGYTGLAGWNFARSILAEQKAAR